MASLSLTPDEFTGVRMQVTLGEDANLLTDAHINSDTVVGTATDYVFDVVRKDITGEMLSNAGMAQEKVDAFLTGNFETFLNTVLSSDDRESFRRAIVFRCARVAIPIFRNLKSEDASDISREWDDRKWTERAEDLDNFVSEQVRRIRDSFLSAPNRLPKINLMGLA